MSKKIKTRNKKTRNKPKNFKNKTKKYGGEINIDSLKEKLTKDKPTASSVISDKLNKVKSDYSYGNLMKRHELFKNDLKKALEEEKEKRMKEKEAAKEKEGTEEGTASKLKKSDLGSIVKTGFYKSLDTANSFRKKNQGYLSDKYNSLGKQTISDEHKELIIAELDKLKRDGKLNDDEHEYAIKQLNQREGITGMKDSFFNILAPVQNMVKVVADWVFNTEDPDFPSKKTHVKLLWVPKMYKNYVKNVIPEKNQKPELEMDDFIMITKNTYASPMEKIYSDMNSVDSLLANTLNGCIGKRCKDGKVMPPILLEKTIDVTNNIRRKEVLNERKKIKESDIELASK